MSHLFVINVVLGLEGLQGHASSAGGQLWLGTCFLCKRWGWHCSQKTSGCRDPEPQTQPLAGTGKIWITVLSVCWFPVWAFWLQFGKITNTIKTSFFHSLFFLDVFNYIGCKLYVICVFIHILCGRWLFRKVYFPGSISVCYWMFLCQVVSCD